MKNTKKGFTLIELLVVVAIIGMLSSVVFASLNTARGNAREARRVQDLKQLQTALELYYPANSNSYPASSSDTTVANSLGVLVTGGYIPSLPSDPLSTRTGATNYRYCANAQSYIMLGLRENGVWCRVEAIQGTSVPCASWRTNYPLCTGTTN